MTLKKVLLIGGDGKFIAGMKSKFFEVGLEIDWHWSELDRAVTKVDALPKGCEAVVILIDVVRHELANKGILLAKKEGVPFARITKMWATGRQQLIQMKIGDPHFLDKAAAEPKPEVTSVKEKEEHVEAVKLEEKLSMDQLEKELGRSKTTIYHTAKEIGVCRGAGGRHDPSHVMRSDLPRLAEAVAKKPVRITNRATMPDSPPVAQPSHTKPPVIEDANLRYNLNRIVKTMRERGLAKMVIDATVEPYTVKAVQVIEREVKL